MVEDLDEVDPTLREPFILAADDVVASVALYRELIGRGETGPGLPAVVTRDTVRDAREIRGFESRHTWAVDASSPAGRAQATSLLFEEWLLQAQRMPELYSFR